MYPDLRGIDSSEPEHWLNRAGEAARGGHRTGAMRPDPTAAGSQEHGSIGGGDRRRRDLVRSAEPVGPSLVRCDASITPGQAAIVARQRPTFRKDEREAILTNAGDNRSSPDVGRSVQ